MAHAHMVGASARWFSGCVLGVAAVALVAEVPAATQQPSFRSSVDLIAVDVQVVDGTGRPVPRLGPDQFEVEINGQRRRVVSADYVEHADPDAPSRRPIDARDDDRPATPRVYVIAVDVSSFAAAESRAFIEGAREFIRRLQPEDAVGVYAFPIGPKFRPTTDHAGIARSLEGIVGSRHSLHNSHGLSAMDVIDITAESARSGAAPLMAGATLAEGTTSETLDDIVARECGENDRPCAQAIQADALGTSFVMQGQVTATLDGLRELVRALGTIDGRKTLVLLSAGMPVSDRPGGRPDVGLLPKLLGQDAARANTTMYALFLETRFSQMISAKTSRPDRSSGDGREQAVFGRVMEEFTGASGGRLLTVAQGTGSFQFDRVLRETSSRYLLGVEPASADRDGNMRTLRVRLRDAPSGTTVRSRLWVVVPKAV
jgi:VWFA-related protein